MIIRARQGEDYAEFFARLVAASGPPTPEEAERLRQLLPLPRSSTAEKQAA